MRLWISTRIPFTPIRVGTSIGGRRRSSSSDAGAGKAVAALIGLLFLLWVLAEAFFALRDLSLSASAWTQLLVGTGIAVVLLALAWLGIRSLLRGPVPPPPPNQAKVSDRR